MYISQQKALIYFFKYTVCLLLLHLIVTKRKVSYLS